MNEKKRSILEAYEFRRAIKEFDENKKITDEDFDFILETGRLSPSSFGWEPWKFLVVQNPVLREKLMGPSWGAQRQLPSASHFVILLARSGKDMAVGSPYLSYKSMEVDHLPDQMAKEKEAFFGNFQEKEFDLTDDRKRFDWAARQVYLPFANMMSSAAQIGIDSCPIEGFDKKEVEKVLKEEGLLDDEHFGVAAMVAFGYRKNDSPYPRSRHPMESVVQWVR
ncbi:MAG: NAD(P)H-dependent oxidoreductase [Sphaerochaetaceae bacterium]|nr:NAD(P)H-dependent oxidoreductase [Sphaerochaetaceae bacterium]